MFINYYNEFTIRIIDPKTNTKHSIYSTTGKLLLKKAYISTFTNGGMENEDTNVN